MDWYASKDKLNFLYDVIGWDGEATRHEKK